MQTIEESKHVNSLADEEKAERAEKAAKLLTLGQRRHLLHGCLEGEKGFDSLASLQEAWRKHGPGLLEEWQHRKGVRPVGYWLTDFKFGDHYSPSDNPLFFGKFVPPMAEQGEILAIHGLLTKDELKAADVESATV